MPDEIIIEDKTSKGRFIYRGRNVYIVEDGVEKLYKVDDEYVEEYAQPKSSRKRITREQLDKLIELIRKS